MEELENCPICNNSPLLPELSCIDYTVSRETFNLVKCSQCGFVFTNPRPHASEIGKYYQSEDYISHSGTKKGFVNLIYHQIRNYTIRKKFLNINKIVSGNVSILDIGCGTGEFLNYCKIKGWNTVGIEPSDDARHLARRNYSLDVFPEAYLNELQDNSFNVITLWHVLEHVHELKNRVKQIKSLLKSDGYAFIAVPNHLSYDAAYYKEHWAAYDVPRHLYHFDKQSIAKLFGQEGLKLVKMLPMKFDSFYVSMLSEKYKRGKTNYLKALSTGLRSNMKAGGKAESYSSVVYVLKHI
jgi:2-polyprenyl-3-methyl-5-hydroxy-6-metoxy-1,4-benzoquinol methylase